MTSLTPLNAISPLDGRYYKKSHGLRDIFSESGLMRYRVTVELQWFQTLSQIKLISPLSEDAQNKINSIMDNFSEMDMMKIKAFEVATNHDIKAVEYFIKDKFQEHKELNALKEWVHIGCTSDDINNISYALMLRDARSQFLVPTMEMLLTHLRTLVKDHKDVVMLSRTHGQVATPTSSAFLGRVI